jgi:hypothetical protein
VRTSSPEPAPEATGQPPWRELLCCSQTTKRPKLQFRALLTEDGPEIELMR